MTYDFTDFKNEAKRTAEWLSKEFSGIRTGRASPALLDSVSVDSYGSKMSISSVAGITSEDARTLRITPWDLTLVKAIEKAIGTSNLGVSASTDERGVRVFFPELTTERRTAIMKVVKEKTEEARVSLRLERDKVWKDLQSKEKEGTISEDERNRLKMEMEKIVHEGNSRLDDLMAKKEREILS